jgi:hypothetical protein
MNTVSKENVEKLLKEKAEVEMELEALTQTSVRDIWMREIEKFEEQYAIYVRNRAGGGVVANSGAKPGKHVGKSAVKPTAIKIKK